MNEYITYCDAKIQARAAEIICELQADPENASRLMNALSFAINQSLMYDLPYPSHFNDAEYRDHLSSLACISSLVKALFVFDDQK